MQIPPKYSVTPEMVELLAKIEAIRQYLLTIEIPITLKKRIHRISLLKSSLYSAKIEGNPLNLDTIRNSPDKIKRLEITNIEKALIFISKQKIKKIGQSMIKNLHKIVMDKIHFQAGRYRTEMSAVFNQAGVAIYVCPSPNRITQLSTLLIDYANSQKEKFPLIKAFVTHLLFEKIHPFLDGNGRVGRLMIPLICLISNYRFEPSVSFEESLNDNKTDYYYHLDFGLKNTNEYLIFMLMMFLKQIEKLKKEIEQEINKKTIIYLPPRQEEILNIIRDHNNVTFDFIRRRFLKIPPRTLRFDLKKLAEKKVIIKIGQTKGSFYKIK